MILFDKKKLDELLLIDQEEPGFVHNLIKMFEEQSYDTLNKLRENLYKKNYEECSRLGHFLKGSTSAFGLIKVSKISETIQASGLGRRDIRDTEITLPREAIDIVLNKNIEILEKYLKDGIITIKTLSNYDY